MLWVIWFAVVVYSKVENVAENIRETRLSLIIEMITKNNIITTNELSTELNVNERTDI